MLIKYVGAWHELAYAFQQSGLFQESLECFQTAIIIYEKLLMYGHISFALGDYILSKLMLFIGNGGLREFTEGEEESPENIGGGDESNSGLTNEELFREILVSNGGNRYSHPAEQT